jgi:hypothetical protein
MSRSISVSTGVRVKTGRAIAILLRGQSDSPVVAMRREWGLIDPKLPDTLQPFHAVLDLPWPAAQKAAEETAIIVRAIASKEIGEWAREVRESGFTLGDVGIVVGSDQNPSKIANPHIRAHAAEGRFFRQAIEAATDALGLSRCSFLEREIYETAAAELGLSVATLKERATQLGETVGRPWRGDEKVAAVSAWVMLVRRSRR